MDDPEFDAVIFDTAPTGHTIRLLQLPQGWSEEIARGGATCIGPSESLSGAKGKYDKAISYLRNNKKTTFVFVMKPEESSFLETKRSSGELEKLGIRTSVLIINGVLPEEACTLDFYKKKKAAQDKIISLMEMEFKDVFKIKYPLRSSELNGSGLLLNVGKAIIENVIISDDAINKELFEAPTLNQNKRELIEKIKPKKGTRYIFVTGKGGVGKSTIACATGVWAAEHGYKTLIVTTDPASHLQTIFGQDISYEPTKITENLSAARVDQVQALKEYKERIMNHILEKLKSTPSAKLTLESTRKKIEEELKSPCSEEMAAFEKFMGYFELKGYDIIIIDTAPTGHTLRLLELPSMWKGFIDLGTLTKDTSDETRNKYANVIDTMKDTAKSTFMFVMYPEYTPLMEAWRASEELKRQVGIKAGLVAVNYILPEKHAKNDFFKGRLNQQKEYLAKIKEKFKVPLVLVPMLEDEPQGMDNLKKLGRKIFD